MKPRLLTIDAKPERFMIPAVAPDYEVPEPPEAAPPTEETVLELKTKVRSEATRSALRVALMAAAMGGGGLPSFPFGPRYRRHRRTEPGIRSVDCPTCRARVGEWCDPRTLGRYKHHRSRLEAARRPDRSPSVSPDSTSETGTQR